MKKLYPLLMVAVISCDHSVEFQGDSFGVSACNAINDSYRYSSPECNAFNGHGVYSGFKNGNKASAYFSYKKVAPSPSSLYMDSQLMVDSVVQQ